MWTDKNFDSPKRWHRNFDRQTELRYSQMSTVQNINQPKCQQPETSQAKTLTCQNTNRLKCRQIHFRLKPRRKYQMSSNHAGTGCSRTLDHRGWCQSRPEIPIAWENIYVYMRHRVTFSDPCYKHRLTVVLLKFGKVWFISFPTNGCN